MDLGVGEMIEKILKNCQFVYNEEEKKLGIFDGEEIVKLSRTQMFSLMRFIIRIAQKGQRRKRK